MKQKRASWKARLIQVKASMLLCLAEIAGREEKWSEVLRHTTRALGLDPAHDPYAYFFSAIAYFNLSQFVEAEQQALKAEELDREHHEPRVQFLLGQISQERSREGRG